jgi:hypothetical protein
LSISTPPYLAEARLAGQPRQYRLGQAKRAEPLAPSASEVVMQ